MLNICETVVFPAIPDQTFNLVLATKRYRSALLEASINGEDVDLDELANEIYAKNGRNIMATFKSTLRSFGIDSSGDFYIVADRASVNVAGFGRYYLCC